MKTPWTPTLTVKEALAICGSLSSPGKMPCHGYALPAQRCRLGSFLQQLPKAICHYCYALRGRYLFPKVRAAMEKRTESLADPRWVEAITTLIYRSGDRFFRWHDSGDLQSIEHLQKIIQVCNFLPRVKFFPSNLCIRLSAHLIDGKPPLSHGLPVSTVSSQSTGIPSEAHICPAPKQNNHCGNCRACWDPSVRIVSYKLKWASRRSANATPNAKVSRTSRRGGLG